MAPVASGGGYEASTTPSVQFFTKEQRQRLEALTFARKLLGNCTADVVHDWVYLAKYIEKGEG